MKDDFVHYHVDYAIRHGDLLFGHGWVFHEVVGLAELQLQGPSYSIPLQYGSPRRDVAMAYPAFTLAEQSGFLFYVRLPTGIEMSKIRLVATFTNGSQCAIPITNLATDSKRWRMIRAFVHRLWSLLRARDFKGLTEKLQRYLRASTFPSRCAPELKAALKGEIVELVIDHNFGGGANLYRAQITERFRREGKAVVLLTYDATLLGYRLEHYATDKTIRHFRLRSLVELIEIFRSTRLEAIFFNNAVGFPDAGSLPEVISSVIATTGARMEVALHDFFLLCPSPHLINYQGVYCDLPVDPQICRNCLRKNKQSFIPIYAVSDVESWRTRWHCVLKECAAIHVFSESSLGLLRKVFPDLQEEAFVYAPHDVEHFRWAEVEDKLVWPIRIGVVGNITHIKGSDVVAELGRILKREEGKRVELVVIGTLHSAGGLSIRQTGSYAHSDLPKVLKEENVNIILFPSICPETFSYVVQEMKMLSYPIVAFDLGAQAEYLRDYGRSLLVPLGVTGEELLSKIIELHEKVYSITNEPRPV